MIDTQLHPSTATVLIVEDDEATQEFVTFFLSASGYTVLEAASGQEALALFATHTIDAVLLDRRLPDMDGIDIARTMRNESSVPIILVTADHDPSLDAQAHAAGINAIITKPFLPDRLLAQIATSLQT